MATLLNRSHRLEGKLTYSFYPVAYSMLAVKQDDFSDVPMPNTLPGVHDVTHENKDKQ